jgi:hypothetical protein
VRRSDFARFLGHLHRAGGVAGMRAQDPELTLLARHLRRNNQGRRPRNHLIFWRRLASRTQTMLVRHPTPAQWRPTWPLIKANVFVVQ